jgi:N-acetylmuramoyl-L-alanine amidase
MEKLIRPVHTHIASILFITVFLIMAALGGTAMSATVAPALTVILNNQQLRFNEVAPIIENGRTLVPLRVIFEAMGATVDWDPATGTATATRGNTTVVLPLNSTQPTVNGVVWKLDVPSRIVGGRTLAPLAFVGRAFGGNVGWDEVNRTVNIQAPAKDGSRVVAVTVGKDGVNLRSGADRSFPSVDFVLPGERLNVLGEQNGWYQVNRGAKNAWVAGWVVDVSWQEAVPPEPIPQLEGLRLSTLRDNSGLRIVMESGVKLETKLNKTSGKITYEFANVQMEGTSYIEPPFGNQLIRAQASNQGKNVVVEIQFPTGVEYLTTTENEGERAVLTIPDFISGVARSTFGNSGEKITISSTVALAYTSNQTGTSLELVLDNVLPGKAQASYNYDSHLISSMEFNGKTAGSVSQTVLTLTTRQPAKFAVGLSSDLATLNIMFIDQSEIQNRVPMVVLDAGHGGKDTGARGDGIDEKDVNLAIVLNVGEILTQKGIKVVYTRNDDSYLSLDEISNIANLYNAALFVSIHSNANLSPDPSGTETYCYYPMENPQLFLQKDERFNLATKLQQALVAKLGLNDRGVKQANFSVLRNTQMPSALVELAFISNPGECELLKQQQFRDLAAQAIADGIEGYMKANIKS